MYVHVVLNALTIVAQCGLLYAATNLSVEILLLHLPVLRKKAIPTLMMLTVTWARDQLMSLNYMFCIIRPGFKLTTHSPTGGVTTSLRRRSNQVYVYYM